jgi:uncharacterized membrane protein YkvA (DUF1232 family)
MKMLRTLMAARTAIVRVVPLMRHADVPTALKLGALALAVLIISPVDLLGDIPVIGLFDDAALLTMLCMWFVSRATKYAEPVKVRPGTSLIPL